MDRRCAITYELGGIRAMALVADDPNTQPSS
jgi:hypothetical protein